MIEILTKKKKRQKAIGKALSGKFIRINPDQQNFNIFKAINKIHRDTEKSNKKLLINKISKKLLELEFNSDHSIKPKCLKKVVKKVLSSL